MGEPLLELPRRRRLGGVAASLTVAGNRNFWPYLAGNMLSSTGMWFQTLAQAILVYRLTGSVFLLGVVSFAQFAAVFVLAPWAGNAADRFDRRRLLIASQLAASAVTGALTLAAALGQASAGVVIAFALLLGVTSAFSTPAMMAFVPSLVEPGQLSTALALNSATFNIARATGPVLAAVVIDTLGTTWAFGINSFSYVALVVGTLAVRPLVRHTQPPTRPRLRESIALVLHDKRLAGLLYVIAAISLATDPAVTLGPAFVSRELGHMDSLAGLLVGAFGAGAVVAAFTVAHRLQGSRTTIAAMLALAGGGVVGFAGSPTLGLAMATLFVMGFGYLAANTAATTRLQLEVEEAQRGRIMALWTIAFLGIRPVGSLIDGAIATWAGLRVATVVMALPALAGAVAIAVLRFRQRRPA